VAHRAGRGHRRSTDERHRTFAAGDVVSNLVIVPVDPNGDIHIRNRFCTVDIVANVLGYYQTPS
jgi:hypothetical protein